MTAESTIYEKQRIFDDHHFDRLAWSIVDWRDQKTQYISLHVAKATLKVCDGDRMTIESEAIPDLGICRTQLINAHELLDTDGMKKIGQIEHKAASPDGALRQLILASGHLACYLESSEHEATESEPLGIDHDANDKELHRIHRITNAVAALGVATEGLGHFYNIDVEAAQIGRMQLLLGPDAGLID